MTFIQYVHTLKILHKLPRNVQKLVLRHIDSDFIRFLIECIINLLHGNFESAYKRKFVRHQYVLRKIAQKNISRARQRYLLTTPSGIALFNTLIPLIITKFGK